MEGIVTDDNLTLLFLDREDDTVELHRIIRRGRGTDAT